MKTELRILRVLLAVCACLQLAFFVLGWSGMLPPASFVQISPAGIRGVPMSGAQQLAGALAGLPALLTLLYGLWRLLLALRNVERKALFSVDTIAHVRAFAGAALASTLLAILEVPLRTLVFRLVLGLPEHKLSIGVSNDQLLLILVCALFYLVTRLMHEARRLAEENEGFI